MPPSRAATPVFTDRSGWRARVFQWLARALCAGCAMVGVAIAFTLVTHVPLPGLGGILAPPTANGASKAARDGRAQSQPTLDNGLGAGLHPVAVEGGAAGAARSAPRPAALFGQARPDATGKSALPNSSASPAQVPPATPADPSPTTTTKHPRAQSATHRSPRAGSRASGPHAPSARPSPAANANSHATTKESNSRVNREQAPPSSSPTVPATPSGPK